jgi:outer membrane protein OmpA-like peptidoglycan-associated protein
VILDMNKHYILLGGLLVALALQVEAKDNVQVYTTAPTAADLAKALGITAKPSSSHAPKKRTRRIVLDSAPASSQQQHNEPSASSSGDSVVLAFPLYFSSGSVELTSQAIPFVNSIGGLMKMDASLRFQIEGHTDSAGSAERNLELSHDRAISVRDFLVNRHSIDPSRLTTVGKGSQEPLQGVAPRDPSNRRVQFRKMG